MIACPHSPDNVVEVESLKGVKVNQVCIGSCTNSSLFDMLKVAALLKGKIISPFVSLSISPGSKQVLTMLSECGALADILASGAISRVVFLPSVGAKPQIYEVVGDGSTLDLKTVERGVSLA